jgi:hypothetical protein
MTDTVLGRLRAATLVCPDFALATHAYREYLGYRLADEGVIDAALAEAWRAPAVAGARFEWLVPASGADVGIRLVEGRGAPFAPYSSWGWNALEIAVADCDRAVARLADGPFRVVGPPADLGFSDGALRAGQVVGPAGEVLYLTQIRRQVPGFALPAAQCLVDQPFIVILHAPDAGVAIEEYRRRFGNPGSPTFQFPVDFMAEFQGLPKDHPYTLGTVALDGAGYFEIDSAPSHIGARPVADGALPPGIAMVTVETPAAHDGARVAGALYAGSTVKRIDGVAGEWLELIAPTESH